MSNIDIYIYYAHEENSLMNLEFAAITFRAIRDRLRTEDPHIDEQTLADTVEGVTDLNELIAAVVRCSLSDEALAEGLKTRMDEMQERIERFQDRAAKRRQIAKEAMLQAELKKVTAPDLTISIRPGMPALEVVNESVIPDVYWQPGTPRLNRQALLSELKGGSEIGGVALTTPEPVLSVRVR